MARIRAGSELIYEFLNYADRCLTFASDPGILVQ